MVDDTRLVRMSQLAVQMCAAALNQAASNIEAIADLVVASHPEAADHLTQHADAHKLIAQRLIDAYYAGGAGNPDAPTVGFQQHEGPDVERPLAYTISGDGDKVDLSGVSDSAKVRVTPGTGGAGGSGQPCSCGNPSMTYTPGAGGAGKPHDLEGPGNGAFKLFDSPLADPTPKLSPETRAVLPDNDI